LSPLSPSTLYLAIIRSLTSPKRWPAQPHRSHTADGPTAQATSMAGKKPLGKTRQRLVKQTVCALPRDDNKHKTVCPLPRPIKR